MELEHLSALGHSLGAMNLRLGRRLSGFVRARTQSFSRTTLLALATIGAITIVLRLWQLDRRSLWFDEIFQSTCSSRSIPDLLDCVRSVYDQTPWAYLVTHFVLLLAGSPPLPHPAWLVRLPEVVAGAATVPVAALLASELLGRRAAWACALLWAISPLAVGYSQEARMYAWLALFSACSALFMVLGLRRPSLFAWVGFAVSTALNLYSHYVSVMVLESQLAFISLWLATHAIKAWKESKQARLAEAMRAVSASFRALLKQSSSSCSRWGSFGCLCERQWRSHCALFGLRFRLLISR